MTVRSESKGIGLMLLAVLLFAVMDGIGKYQSNTLPTFQLLLIRTIWIVVLSLIWIRIFGSKSISIFRVPNIRLQLVRGLVWTFSALFFYLAFAGDELTEVYLISFAHPAAAIFFALIIRKRFPRLITFAPMAVMFIGIVISTSGNVGGNATLGAKVFAALAAIFFGLEAVLTKEIDEADGDVDKAQTLAISATVGLLMYLCGIWLHYEYWSATASEQYIQVNASIGPPLVWPDLTTALMLVAQGVAAFFGNLAFIYAYKYADESLLAPVDYTIIIFSAIIGAIFFGEVISASFWIGGAIIASGGIWLAALRRR